jgi:hypothetical protein
MTTFLVIAAIIILIIAFVVFAVLAAATDPSLFIDDSLPATGRDLDGRLHPDPLANNLCPSVKSVVKTPAQDASCAPPRGVPSAPLHTS